jgi:hypothetical protein
MKIAFFNSVSHLSVLEALGVGYFFNVLESHLPTPQSSMYVCIFALASAAKMVDVRLPQPATEAGERVQLRSRGAGCLFSPARFAQPMWVFT